MKRKTDIMDIIEEILGEKDPEMKRIIREAKQERDEFEALGNERKLLEIEVHRDHTKIKYNVDKIDQMCIVANMAIDHILEELPRAKRKAVLMAAITGLEMKE